jgi:Putative Ig domain
MLGTAGCQLYSVDASTEQNSGQPPQASSPVQDAPQLVIEIVSLPGTYLRATYLVRMHARGGTTPYHWKLEKGDLPPGLKLEDDGTLQGSPEKLGEYHVTISVTDNSRPAQAVQREYTVNVVAAMSMQWKVPAHVTGNRIEGSVAVSNTTPDDFDFTFIVLAVNENGRATAIGYQRFPLKKGTTDFEIPFGETVAHGSYVVHVDGVGEVAEKNQIHRARLQTPVALQAMMGP